MLSFYIAKIGKNIYQSIPEYPYFELVKWGGEW